MYQHWRKHKNSCSRSTLHSLARNKLSKSRIATFEQLEERIVLTTPFGAFPSDTGEFLLGDIVVSVVLFESDGSIDNSLEDWTPQLIDNSSDNEDLKGVKQKVQDSLDWWIDTLRNIETGYTHPLNFTIDYTFTDNPVATGVEPINLSIDQNELWINNFLDAAGFNSSLDFHSDMLAFNHAQREKFDADWAFTVFVINSTNDNDDAFSPDSKGRTWSAYAFPGGRFTVVPSQRPAETFAHEIGHIFWALDEHRSGASYNALRGYYNIQNTNSLIDHPLGNDFGPLQDPSIMGSGNTLTNAYLNNISSIPSLEMVGWRDSDGDGIFDVIDVPHSLTGSGFYDVATGEYHFVGQSSVQTLPNLNSSGNGNDITINRINRVQYRIDGSANPWQDLIVTNQHEADMYLRINVPANFNTIEIRTLDDRTGITSPIFVGGPSAPTSMIKPGINGFIRWDFNGDGNLSGDSIGLAGWTVRLVDDNGQILQLTDGVEPDDYALNTIVNTVNPNVTLSAIGIQVDNNKVIVRNGDPASTGTKIFRNILINGGGLSSTWSSQTRELKIEFTSPVTTVSLDAISNSSTDYGRLEIYDAEGNLLDRYTTRGLADGQVETMTLSRATPEIAYAIAWGHAGTAIQFDNLQFGPQAVTVSDNQGSYSLPYLSAGTYNVELVSPPDIMVTTPSSQQVVLTAGASIGNVDFGAEPQFNPWQNSTDRADVNNNGQVDIDDANILIDYIRLNGSHNVSLLTPPPLFADVDGNYRIDIADIFYLIDILRDDISIEVEGEGISGSAAVASEGEFTGNVPVLSTLSIDVLPTTTAADTILTSSSANEPVLVAFPFYIHSPNLSHVEIQLDFANSSHDKTTRPYSDELFALLAFQPDAQHNYQGVSTRMTGPASPLSNHNNWSALADDSIEDLLASPLDESLLELLALQQGK